MLKTAAKAVLPAAAVVAAHELAKPETAKSAGKPTARKPYLSGFDDAPAPKKDGEMPLSRVLLDLFVKLAVVLGIAYGALYLLRGWMHKAGAPIPGGRKNHMKLLETVSLGPNRALHLVRVGRKLLVVGSTPERVEQLSEIDDPEMLDQLLSDGGGHPFSTQLERAYTGEDSGTVAGQLHGGIHHLQERIKEIQDFRSGKRNSLK